MKYIHPRYGKYVSGKISVSFILNLRNKNAPARDSHKKPDENFVNDLAISRLS